MKFMKDIVCVCEQEGYVSYLGVTYWKVRYRCGSLTLATSQKLSGKHKNKKIKTLRVAYS